MSKKWSDSQRCLRKLRVKRGRDPTKTCSKKMCSELSRETSGPPPMTMTVAPHMTAALRLLLAAEFLFPPHVKPAVQPVSHIDAPLVISRIADGSTRSPLQALACIP